MSKENEIENAVAAGIEKAFSVDAGRYIDVSRIPLICQSIVGIHTELKGLKENMEKRYVTKEGFWPVRTIVYGLVGIILIGVITAILLPVIPHK